VIYALLDIMFTLTSTIYLKGNIILANVTKLGVLSLVTLVFINGVTIMSLETCIESLRKTVGDNCGLDATLKFDCGNDGVVFIDGKSTPNTVTNDNLDAQCTVSITLDNLQALIDGSLEPTTGFMLGKFKVAGDMSVAMRLRRVV
jgi:putative sterol carrier protein